MLRGSVVRSRSHLLNPRRRIREKDEGDDGGADGCLNGMTEEPMGVCLPGTSRMRTIHGAL